MKILTISKYYISRQFLKSCTRLHGLCIEIAGDYLFPSQDAKHKNILRQLHAMDSLFDDDYSQRGNRFLPMTEA